MATFLYIALHAATVALVLAVLLLVDAVHLELRRARQRARDDEPPGIA